MIHGTKLISLLIAAITLGHAPALAGDTVPPPGPITGTMKTLDQVQPWKPINELPAGPNALHVITEPGVYYLTEDISPGPGQHGVEIELDGLPPGEYYVCCVSNGYAIRMQPGSLDGIHYTDGVGHTETIEICTGYSDNLLCVISGAGDDGIDVNDADHLIVRNMQITGSGDDAIQATVNGIAEWESIVLVGAGGDGIDAAGKVPPGYIKVKLTNVLITGIAGDGARLVDFQNTQCTDLTVNGSGGNGLVIRPSADPMAVGAGSSTVGLDRCSIGSSGIDGLVLEPQTSGTYKFEVRVTDSLANTGAGIYFEDNVTDCFCTLDFDTVNASGNGGHGIHERHLASGGAPDSTEGVWRSVNTNSNGGDGILADLQECSISKSMDSSSSRFNTGDGLRVQTGNLTQSVALKMEKFTAARNGGSGMHVLPVGGAAVSDHCIVEMNGCSATRNTLHGVHFDWTQVGGPFQFDIKDSTLSHNTANGLFAQAADGCGKDNDCNSNGGSGLLVLDASVAVSGGAFSNNGGDGISSDNASCWVRVAQCSGNTGSGVSVTMGDLSIDGGLFASNTLDGIRVRDADATISRCTARANGGDGASLAGITADRKQMLEWYKAMQNTGNGLVMQRADGAVISNCTTSGNGGRGIWCQNLVSNCTIIDNNCNGDGGGIQVDGTNNVIQCNTATFGALGGITVAPGNLEGMPVDIANINTHSNPPGNVVR